MGRFIHSFSLSLSSWTGWYKHGQLWQGRWPVWWQCWHPGKQMPLCLLVGAPVATREVATHWHPEIPSGLPSPVQCGNWSFLRILNRLIPIWTGMTPWWSKCTVFCRWAKLLSSIQLTEHWLCRVQRQMGDSSVSFSNIPFWSQRTHPAGWQLPPVHWAIRRCHAHSQATDLNRPNTSWILNSHKSHHLGLNGLYPIQFK